MMGPGGNEEHSSHFPYSTRLHRKAFGATRRIGSTGPRRVTQTWTLGDKRTDCHYPEEPLARSGRSREKRRALKNHTCHLYGDHHINTRGRLKQRRPGASAHQREVICGEFASPFLPWVSNKRKWLGCPLNSQLSTLSLPGM